MSVQSKSQNTASVIWMFLQGIQVLLSCLGATVLAPILMGIPPHMALFTSGLGTVAYVLVTRLPIFLGSSFAYIAAISLVMQTGTRAEVAGGIILAGLVSIVVSLVVRVKGVAFIRNILPTYVNANILIAIGMVLVPVAFSNVAGNWVWGVATIFVVVAFALFFDQRHLITGLPIFLGVVVMYVAAWFAGLVDVSSVTSASILTTPEFFMPTFTLLSLTVVWPTIATIAEDYADVVALGVVFDEKLEGKFWKSLLMDGIADILSFLGNPSTPYNESIGATQLAKNQNPGMTRAMFIPVILVAAVLAIAAGFMGWVTPLVMSIPVPVIGGVFWIVLGIIAVLGLRLFASDSVDFMDPHVFSITMLMTLAWLAGAAGMQFNFFGIALGPIAACAVVGITAHQLRRFGYLGEIVIGVLLVVWVAMSGFSTFGVVVLAAASILTPVLFLGLSKADLDYANRWVQIPMAVAFTLVVSLVLLLV